MTGRVRGVDLRTRNRTRTQSTHFLGVVPPSFKLVDTSIVKCRRRGAAAKQMPSGAPDDETANGQQEAGYDEHDQDWEGLVLHDSRTHLSLEQATLGNPKDRIKSA